MSTVRCHCIDEEVNYYVEASCYITRDLNLNVSLSPTLVGWERDCLQERLLIISLMIS